MYCTALFKFLLLWNKIDVSDVDALWSGCKILFRHIRQNSDPSLDSSRINI